MSRSAIRASNGRFSKLKTAIWILSLSWAANAAAVPPVADAQSVQTNEDTPKNITLTGSDGDGDPLTFAVVTIPAQGVLSGTLPNITYSPNFNYNGTDSFTFKVNDGTADSSPATVSITINAVNDPPVASNQFVDVDEDTPKPITLTASDPENDPLNWIIVTLPSHGNLTGTAPNLTYTPNPNFVGFDAFTFKVNDGELDSTVKTINITVFAVNDPPVANPKSVTTAEDEPLLITLTGSDPEGDSLTFMVSTPPMHGAISGTPPTVTYTPDAFYFGEDSFQFRAHDGNSQSAPATVSITITPVNDAPFVEDDFITLSKGGTQTVLNGGSNTLLNNDSDIEGDAMSVTTTPVVPPANGVVTLFANGTFSYTHDNSLNLGDVFTYQVCDNGSPVECATAQVHVLIDLGPEGICAMPEATIPDNDPTGGVSHIINIGDTGPVATVAVKLQIDHSWVGDLVATLEHQGKTVRLLDRPGRPTISAGCNGRDVDVILDDDASITASQYCLTTSTTPDITGTLLPVDAFSTFQGDEVNGNWTLKVTDHQSFDTGTLVQWCLVRIINPPGNTAPTANSQAVSTNEEQAKAITLSGSDPQGDSLSYKVVTQPAHGTLTGTPPNLTYTPALNYFGADSFSFTVKDGFLTSGPATVSITVTNVNDAPTAVADRLEVPKGDVATTLVGGANSLLANDSDLEGNALTLSTTPVLAPAHGVLTLNANGTFSYDHDNTFTPVDRFVYQVCDNGSPSQCASASVDIWTDLSASPECSAPRLPIADGEDEFATADTINFAGAGGVADLTLLLDIEHPFVGDLSATLNHSGLSTALLDRPGTTNPDLNSGCSGDNVAATFNDAAANAAESQCASPPPAIAGQVRPNGLLSQFDGSGKAGDWTLEVFDLQPFETGTLRQWCLFLSLAGNSAPYADPQTVNTPEEVALGIILTGGDVDGDSITFSVVEPPESGILSGTAPNLTYTPNSNFFGQDSFTFRTHDGSLYSATTAITINVSNVNDAPSAHAQAVSTDEDTAKSINLTGSDPDGDSLTYSIVNYPAHGLLSGTAPNLNYTPDFNYNGNDSFTFRVHDGTVFSSNATVSLTINPVNDVPVALPGSKSVIEDTATQISLFGLDADGDALTYAIVSGPTHGNISGTPPVVTYTPDTNYTGSDSFSFKVNDGFFDSSPANISITVTPVNDAPLAGSDSLTVFKGQATSILDGGPVSLLDNDTDPEGNTMAVTTTPVATPLHGNVSLNANGTFTYTHDDSFSTSDSFVYEVCDDGSPVECSVAEATVYIVLEDSEFCRTPLLDIPDNDPVTGVLDTLNLTTAGGITDVNILLQLSHAYIGELTLQLSHNAIDVILLDRPGIPAQGPLGCPGQDIEVFFDDEGSIPAQDECATEPPAIGGIVIPLQLLAAFDGENSLGDWHLQVTDAASGVTGLLEQWCVLANVAGNTAPVAIAQSVSTNEDVAKPITLTGSDIDGDPLTFAVAAGPGQGVLSGTPPNLIYTPNTHYNGPDSFTFTVNDGIADSPAATVDITVNAVNDVPVANAQSLSTDEDTAKPITLTGSDVEGSPLTFNIVSGPSIGVLSGTAPNLTYIPNLNVNGADSFSFTVNDGMDDSSAATVTITIQEVNDTPVADDQEINTNEDMPVAITLTGSDVDGDALNFILLTAPSNGILTGTPPNLTYSPAAMYFGVDSFTFKVNDGALDSPEATVTITVESVNDIPVADAQSVSTDEDTAKPITLTGSDGDGDPLSFSIASAPGKGALSGTPPNVVYTPDANYFGSDSFTFTVNDGFVDSTAATVSITVNSVNDVPVAGAQSVSTSEDTAKPITLSGSDVEGSPLTFNVASGPSSGILSGTAPNLTYTPNPNVNGTDSFDFTVNDGTDDSAPATVSITIQAVNDAPVADDQEVDTDEDTPKAITLTGSDVDGDALEFSIVSPPGKGQLSGAPPNVTYTPNNNTNGADSFTFKIYDGTVDSDIAAVTISVNPVNDVPLANNQSVGTNEDTPKPIILTGSDPDGDALVFSIVTPPGNGNLTGTPPNLTYTPTAMYFGPDSFTFKVNDGQADSNIATVSISIGGVNDAPSADPQSLATDEDTALPLTLTGSDGDGDALSYIIVSQPTIGLLSGIPPVLTYTPNANANGPDVFTFKVNDGTVDSSTAVINIMVNPVNDAPVANSQAAATDEDTSKALLLTGSDIEGSALTFSIVSSPAKGSLTGTPPNVTYVPDADSNGGDSFSFKVNDGELDSVSATVTLTVAAINDPPVAKNDAIQMNQGDTATQLIGGATSLLANDSDVEGNNLSVSPLPVSAPVHGTLGLNPNGSFTYTHDDTRTPSDSFSYEVCDDGAPNQCSTAEVTIGIALDEPVELIFSSGFEGN